MAAGDRQGCDDRRDRYRNCDDRTEAGSLPVAGGRAADPGDRVAVDAEVCGRFAEQFADVGHTGTSWSVSSGKDSRNVASALLAWLLTVPTEQPRIAAVWASD